MVECGRQGAAIDELTRTEPLTVIETVPPDTGRLRPNRSFALVAVALAVVIAGSLWRVVSRDDAVLVSNPSRVYSPSGHRPNRPSSEPVVTVAWTPVKGAAGYWWALVNDTSNLPDPVIRASADDGMVSFKFTGRRYFVLRTAIDAGGGYRWSDALVYGPIIVQRGGGSSEPALEDEAGTSDREVSSGGRAYRDLRSGADGSPGSRADDSRSSEPAPPPRGNPGEPGVGTGQPGGYGEPGEPGSGGGAGEPSCQGGSCPGEQGANGPDGAPGRPQP